MGKETKIVYGQDAGIVVAGVNRLLAEGWRIMHVEVKATHARNRDDFAVCTPQGLLFLVPEFCYVLTRDEEP